MKHLKLIPIIFIFALVSSVIVSCTKKSDKKGNTGTGTTDLQVYVLDANSAAVSNASVKLYLTEEARDAESGDVGSYITGEKGIAYFGNLPVNTYYVNVIKNDGNGITTTGKADTGAPLTFGEQSAVTVFLQ